MHIKEADSGASVHEYADQLVIENNGNNGITFLGTTSSGTYLNFGDSGSNVAGQIIYDHSDTSMSFKVETAGVLVMQNDKSIYIGETVNTQTSNASITINQDGADDEIFALKSSDIAHGITQLTETDTYFCISKEIAANGGALLQGWSEDKRAIHIQGVATAIDTTDTSDSLGAVRIEAQKRNGTTTTSLASTEVICSIEDTGQTRWLIKGNGDIHSTTDAHTALDAFSDSELCRVFDIEYANPASIIKSKWDDFINDEDRQEQLIAAGLISRMSPEHEENGATPLFNASQLQRLHNGAIWQQHEKHHNLLNAVYELAVQSVGEEEADNILEKHDVKLLN